MRSIARATSGYSGRKNLLWVSGGFPVALFPDRAPSSVSTSPRPGDVAQINATDASTVLRSYGVQIQLTSNALADSHVAIYPVDAKMLVGYASADASQSGREDRGRVNKGTDYADELARSSFRLRNTQATMLEVAEETGGRAFMNTNDIANSLTIGTEEAKAAYMMAYAPQSQKWDGKFRSLHVKVNDPALKVRHRPGYYAFDPAKVSSRQKEEHFKSAVADPLPATEVTFLAHALPAVNSKLGLEFLVPSNQIVFERAAEEKRHCEIDFVVTAVGADGKVLSMDSKTVTADFNPAVFSSVESKGIPFRMQVDTKPGTESYRLLVRDKLSGRVGRIDIPKQPF